MKYLIQNKNWNINKNYNFDKILYLLIDRPDKIKEDYFWLYKDKLHRDYDLPSGVNKPGYIFWHHNGNFIKVITPRWYKNKL